MPVYPGAMPMRPRRASSLLLGWRASDGSLEAYTGQLGSLFNHPTTHGPIIGANGITVQGARNLPRFTQALDATTRLRLQGDVVSTYDERVTFPFNVPVQALTVMVRLRSLYTLVAGGIPDPGNFALMLGATSAAGGRLTLSRSTGGVWRARRWKADPSGGSLLLTGTETTSWVHPFDLLVSLNLGGTITFAIRDGGGTMRLAPATSTADTDLISGADMWNSSVLILGCGFLVGGERGGDFDYEAVKVARGTKTHAEMDALS